MTTHFFVVVYLFVILAFLTWLIVVTDKTSKAQAEKKIRFENLPKPGKKVWALWIALIIVMVSMCIIFNGH